MKILIVDDERVIREGIKRTIAAHFPHCRIYLAASPEEAVVWFRKERIDIVLTDILMPGMSGLELISLTAASYPHMKWVVISAHSEFAYAQKAVSLGAKSYLLKPIGKETLIEMMEKLAADIACDKERIEASEQLRLDQKYWREAVFQRWTSGLDIGGGNFKKFLEGYTPFFFFFVGKEKEKIVSLEHFIVENVLSELIARYGRGFAALHDSKSLIGLVDLHEGGGPASLLEELRGHLVTYLRVPFQLMHSELIDNIHDVPGEVQRMRRASATQVYEHYANGGDQAVDVALQYIRTHFADDLSLEKVATVVYLNPVYFSQLFKQKTGSGFKEYVIGLRMEHAKSLLLNPSLKLADVAERIGYQDIRHFSALFRKKYGLSPSEYRQNKEGLMQSNS